jgi:hypothetical protein
MLIYETSFEQMLKAWYTQKPVETLFKLIQDYADFSEEGDVVVSFHHQHINVGYAKIFSTGNFMSACRRWNDK